MRKIKKIVSISIALGSIIASSTINNLNPAAADSDNTHTEEAGAPDNRRSAGTRSDCISANNQIEELIALMPSNNNIGTTLSPSPAIFVYVPQTNNKKGEFIITEGNETVYNSTIELPSQAGIIQLDIPRDSSVSGLKAGQDYKWTFTIVCNPQNRSEDEYVSGYVKRIDNSQLEAEIQQIPTDERLDFYAREGIWLETVNTIVQMRQNNPQDSALVADWQNLLESVGLGDVASQPLIQP